MPDNILEQIKNSTDDNYDSIDLDSLSLDDLKSAFTEEQPPAQERDDKGRFKSSNDDSVEPADDATEDEDEEVTYRREIDLGDGSGVQVFEASTPEELINKLVDAQINATKKIREQATQLKEAKASKEAEQQADDEDEFVLSQEIMSRPTEAVRKAFKKATGMDITEFKSVAERVKALDNAQQAQADLEAQNKSAEAFIADHPEYVPSPENGTRLTRAVNLLIAEAKNNNEKINYGTLLLKAYQDLSTSGLLKLKSSDDVTAEGKTSTGAANTRIEQADEVVTPQRTVRKSSSLASRSRNVTAATPKEPSEDDLLDMSLDDLKKWASQQRGR